MSEFDMLPSTCPTCNGKGMVEGRICKDCDGWGEFNSEEELPDDDWLCDM